MNGSALQQAITGAIQGNKLQGMSPEFTPEAQLTDPFSASYDQNGLFNGNSNPNALYTPAAPNQQQSPLAQDMTNATTGGDLEASFQSFLQNQHQQQGSQSFLNFLPWFNGGQPTQAGTTPGGNMGSISQ